MIRVHDLIMLDCSPSQKSVPFPEIYFTTQGGSRFPASDPLIMISVQVKISLPKLFFLQAMQLFMALHDHVVCREFHPCIAWL